MNKIDADYNKNKPMGDRLIYCDLMQTLKYIRECKTCLYKDNCKYREHGSMRRIKIDWNNV